MKRDEAYDQYESGLRYIHELNEASQGEAAEADRVRDDLDAAWRALSDEDRSRLAELSHDLYSLSDEEIETESAPPPRDERERDELRVSVQRSFDAGRWSEVLHLLRRLRREIPPALLAYARGRCWHELGRIEPALWFFERASALEPENLHYQLVALDTLSRSSRSSEAVSQARTMLRAREPELVVGAATVLFSAAKRMSQYEARQVDEDIAAALPRAIAANPQPTSLAIAARLNLALVLEQLGKDADALAEYDGAVAKHPDSDETLAARALFLLAKGRTEDARRDLDRVASKGTHLAYPYAYLAYIAIEDRNYDRALALCEMAIQRADRQPMLFAVVFECTAIALFHKEGPSARARLAFEHALTLAPMNERLRKNFELFERVSSNSAATAVFTLEEPDQRAAREMLRARLDVPYDRAA